MVNERKLTHTPNCSGVIFIKEGTVPLRYQTSRQHVALCVCVGDGRRRKEEQKQSTKGNEKTPYPDGPSPKDMAVNGKSS